MPHISLSRRDLLKISAASAGCAAAACGEASDFDSRASVRFTEADEVPPVIRTAGYSAPGDGGGATYVIARARPARPGALTVELPSGGKAWYELSEPIVTPQMFGAIGDGETDATRPLQDAIDYLQAEQSVEIPSLILPTGTYLISRPLVAERTGNHFRLTAFHPRSGIIRAAKPMDEMLKLGAQDSISSRYEIDHIRFDANSRAQICLNARFARYSDIHHCAFVKLPPTGTGLIMGRWVNRIRLNEFDGKNPESGQAGTGILIPRETTNDLQIEGNSFSSLRIGIHSDAIHHDIKIVRNTFDVCTAAGIFLSAGGRNTIITQNYFEKCGRGAPDDGVSFSSRDRAQRYSAPILASWHSGSARTALENVVVEENEFAHCGPSGLGIFNGLKGLRWDKNHALRQFKYDCAVRLVEDGALYTGGSIPYVIIRQIDLDNQFDQLVQLEGNDPENSHCGLELAMHSARAAAPAHTVYDLLPTNLTSPPWAVQEGRVNQAGFLETLDPIFRFSENADLISGIDLEGQQSSWCGRYFRTVFLTKGAGRRSNGVWFRVYTDDGSGTRLLAESARHSKSSWTAGGRNMTFYIAPEVTKIRIRLTTIYDHSAAFIARFHLDSASVPPRG